MLLRNLVFTTVIFAVTAAIFAHTPTVSAQTATGVKIQPSTIEQSAEPGAVIDETLTITNVSDTRQTYYFLVKDISGVTEGNVPIFAEEGAPPTGFELSTWVVLPTDPITLEPNQSAPIPVRINVPGNATPGSHFGGVFATVEPPRLRSTGAAVGYEVGAIVSIRIAGDVIESARMREFSTEKLIYSKPEVTFTARVENPGNVLLRPRGPLEVFNMFGKRIALLSVNDSLAGVFPGTTRPFEIVWKDDGIGFGRYQAIIGLTYGEEGRQSTVSGTVSFWILPAQVILPILGGLAFVILVGYIGVRLYIKQRLNEIATVGGRRRIVPRRRRVGGISRLAVAAVTLLAATAIFLIGLLVLFA